MINVQGAIVTVLGCIGVMILFNGTLRRPVLTGSLAVTKPVLRTTGELAGTEPVKRLNAAANEVKSVPKEARQRASAALKELPPVLLDGAMVLAQSGLEMEQQLAKAAQSGDFGKRHLPPAPDGSNSLTIIPPPSDSDPRVQEERKARQKAIDRFRQSGRVKTGDETPSAGQESVVPSPRQPSIGYDPRSEEDRAKTRIAVERLRRSGSMKQ